MSKKKPEEFVEFKSAKEFIEHFEQRKANRTKFEIVKDYFYYDIYCTLENILHPKWNYYRLQRLIQRIFRGWDDSDLWSLDVTIAKKFKDYFIWSCNSDYDCIIDSLNYVIDDKNFIDYEKDDYKNEYLRAEKIYNKGITKFKEIFFTLDNNFIKKFSEFVYERLIVFKTKINGCPNQFVTDDSDEAFKVGLQNWKDEIDKIIYSMNTLKFMGSGIEKYDKKVKYGFESFCDNLRSLWD